MTLIKKISVSFVACLIALFTATAVPAQAAELESQSVIDATVEELLNYAILDDNGDILGFDVASAEQNEASETVIAAAEEFNAATLEAADSAGMNKSGLNVFHGNWCGPGHSGPGEPIDLLDSRCKTHDLCYAKNGYFNKWCDRVLVAQLTVDINADRYSGSVLAKAYIIRSFFLPNAVLG